MGHSLEYSPRPSTGSGIGVTAPSAWDYELEEYVGHRFDLSQSWSTTLTGVNYQYVHGNAPINNDFQEVSVAGSYLDSGTLTAAYIPNAVRYDRGYRLGRLRPPTRQTWRVNCRSWAGCSWTAGVGY